MTAASSSYATALRPSVIPTNAQNAAHEQHDENDNIFRPARLNHMKLAPRPSASAISHLVPTFETSGFSSYPAEPPSHAAQLGNSYSLRARRAYDPTFSDSPFFYDRRAANLASKSKSAYDGAGSGVGEHSKLTVAYFHPKDVGLYHFGAHHPMKAYRLTLTHALVLGYGLHEHMEVHSPRRATKEEIAAFHADDYVEYLSRVTPASLAKDIAYNTSLANSAAKEQVLPPGLAATATTSGFRLPGSDILGPLSGGAHSSGGSVSDPFGFYNDPYGAGDLPEGHIDTHRIGSDDCPAFAGMFGFFQQYAGASLAAARRMCAGACDIAINWSGGLHHAKKGEASGFCYVNDIVLAILELLRVHPRVLYIDIDIHHGDGVQEAFYRSNRVLTVSFHKYGDFFFPMTGAISETGLNEGKHFSLNVPLNDGIDDDAYVSLFRSVIEPTIATFRPSAIVLQCGADSLGSDRLGVFNLSIKAHGECVRFVKSFNLPLLVLGGGGYRQSSVSRCWTYETSVLAGVDVSTQLPSTPYDAYFEDMSLHPALRDPTRPNKNTPQELNNIRRKIREQLRALNGAPSVQMNEIPPSLTGLDDDMDLDDEEMEEDAGWGSEGDVRIVLKR